MSERSGEMDERDVDAHFASIIARWDREPSPEGPDSDPTPPRIRAIRAPSDPPAAEPSLPGPVPVESASTWRGPTRSTPDSDSDSDSDDEAFEPPPVVLPPHEDLHFWGAVAGLVAGPLLLVYVAMVRPAHSTRWFVAAVALSLVGFALLVLRQPRDRDPADGDDGARL